MNLAPNLTYKSSMKIFAFIFMLLSSTLAFSQQHSEYHGKLTIHGRVENKNKALSHVLIEVYKDNELMHHSKTHKNGAFKIDLPLGSVYNIDFSLDSYVNKSIAVIAKSDSLEVVSGRYFYQIDIELFRVDQDEIDETVLPPAAKLYMVNPQSGFMYDKKYVRWVSGEYKDVKD